VEMLTDVEPALPSRAVVSGFLSPVWLEWFMGFPPGWTETE
jgi:hypothetical protein